MRYLLSGFLACEECGGSFHAQRRREVYGRGWHRDRGEHVCGNSLRVPREALEARVLGAIRNQILVPENLAYAAERALRRFAEGLRPEDPSEARNRLREIEVELSNLARFAAKTGKVGRRTHHSKS